MLKREIFVCQDCKTDILKPESGVILHGNLYKAAPSDVEDRTIVGDLFPVPVTSKAGKRRKVSFKAVDVGQRAYCNPCFQKLLQAKPVAQTANPVPIRR